MTSIREEAARVAMVSALSNGATIAQAHLAAQEAAAAVNPLPPLPQQSLDELTDAELKAMDPADLSCAELDRLGELDAQDEYKFQTALDATLPKGKVWAQPVERATLKMTEDRFLDLAKDLAEAHDAHVEAVAAHSPEAMAMAADVEAYVAGPMAQPDDLSTEGDPCVTCVDHPCKGCPQNSVDDKRYESWPACASCYDPECLGDCPVEQDLKAPPVCTVSDDCGDCTMCFDPDDDNEGDCPRSGSPGFAADMAAEFAAAQHDAYASLQGRDDPVDAGDFGAGTRGNPTPPKLRAEGLAAFMGGIDAENGAEDAGPTYVRVRDCDVPATLRAVDIPANEDGNGIQQWFDNHDDMLKFLASRQCYIADGAIKDYDGNTVGMWFYAHFGPTPVS